MSEILQLAEAISRLLKADNQDGCRKLLQLL